MYVLNYIVHSKKLFQSTTVTSQYSDYVQEFAVQIWSERVLTFRDYIKVSFTKDPRMLNLVFFLTLETVFYQ